MFRFLFLATALPIVSFASAAISETPYITATLRHIESGGIGYQDGYTTFGTFVSSDPSKWSVTPFLDLRGHVFDNGKWAANGGIGLRALWKGRAYGINAYYDYRDPGHFNANQIGAGLETLGELFDFRLNGYLPVGAKTSAPYHTYFQAFSGHSIMVSSKYQSAMKGADAEFGFHFGAWESFDFYAAAGPYYFVGEIDRPIWGGKGRLSVTYKDLLTLQISDSYDRTFHNKFQGEISLTIPLGRKEKCKETKRVCKNKLNQRLVQPVYRQEIIVIDTPRKNTPAIDPATGLPYFVVFVNNTSSSNGTYESPYHTLAQAESNSAPNQIIYVFPGNGTTQGMNSGITLKNQQKFWGSGVSHSLATTLGTISIPQQTSTSPTITNTNADTDGNAVNLAANNQVSGFTIAAPLNDALYGTSLESLEVASCTFQNVTTFAIEAQFPGSASISITNNLFTNNVNGLFFDLKGTSTLNCSNNTFRGQTSPSEPPISILAENNTLTSQITNNLFDSNISGTNRYNLTNVNQANLSFLSNRVTNNGTGSQSSLGSSVVIVASGTIPVGAIVLEGNTFTGNTSNALYFHTAGQFTNLSVTASSNTLSNIGGSAIVLATPSDTLTLVATSNTITQCGDNGIAVISSGNTTSGNITIANNTITNITNSSNGIAVNQDFTTLNLTLTDNVIDECEGTGVISYSPTGIDSFRLSASGNTISNCSNGGSNAASAFDIEQFTDLAATVAQNHFSTNVAPALFIGSTLTAPTACLTLTGNENDGTYNLTNPGDGTFNLSPCNVDSVNVGTINSSGAITSVQSCPGASPCPP